MQYIYAFIFAVLISPLQSWLGAASGVFMNKWDRLLSDFATGALFAYAALLGMEALLRLQLLPTFVREARPRTVHSLVIIGWVTTIIGVLLLGMLWQADMPYDAMSSAAYLFAAALCSLALVLALATIWLESIGKAAIDMHITNANA